MRYGFVDAMDDLGPWILAGLLLAGQRPGPVGHRLDGPTVVHQHPAEPGRPHPARPPLEQVAAEARFQGGETAAQGRLGGIEAARGRCQAAGFVNGKNQGQIAG